jgi:endonuclease I
MGDKLLLKLNIYGKPIANKYCEGKMKRTLKRGLKDLKSLKRKRMKDNIDNTNMNPAKLVRVLHRLGLVVVRIYSLS